MSIREFTDGDLIEQALLVRDVERRAKRDGDEFLRLTLGDRTGSLTAMLWDGVAGLASVPARGSIAWVCGRFAVHAKYGAQLTLSELRPAREGEYDVADLLDGPPRSAAQMEVDLRELLATVQNPWLRELLDRLVGEDSPTWPAYRDAPAAKYYHQAYAHGLLEHCLSVAQGVSALAATFPGIDRDTAVTGALLHDIGKLEAYQTEGLAIDLSDAGKLQGEIPLGYYRVRRLIEEIDGFPAALAQAVGHIILSHHGSLEHGSPVLPATREATLVHMIDNLGGRLGSFDRIEKELPEGAAWSSFDRALGGGAFFGERAAA